MYISRAVQISLYSFLYTLHSTIELIFAVSSYAIGEPAINGGHEQRNTFLIFGTYTIYEFGMKDGHRKIFWKFELKVQRRGENLGLFGPCVKDLNSKPLLEV